MLCSLLVLFGACSSGVCDGVSGTCVDVHVTSTAISSVNQLLIDVSGAVTVGPTPTPSVPQVKGFPLDVALTFKSQEIGTENIHVVAVGGQGSVEGSSTVTLVSGKHSTVNIALGGTVADLAVQASDMGTDMLAGMSDMAGVDMLKPVVAFTAMTPIATGSNPVSVALGDFKNRSLGPIDIAVANQGDTTLTVFFSDTMGGYPATPSYTDNVGYPPHVGAISLFSDASQQILLTNDRFDVDVFDYTGSTFTNVGGQNTSLNYMGPSLFTIGDFDGDSKDDAIVLGGSPLLWLYPGNGAGGLNAGMIVPLSSLASALASGDFNGDHNLDLVVGQGASNIGIMIGNGHGVFAAPVNYPAGSNPDGIAVGDFNGDHHLDLAVSDNGGSINVLLGIGDGTFGTAHPYSVGSQPSGIVTADFDGDLILDLAVTNASSNTVSVLIGDGAGLFGPKHDFAVGAVPSSLAAGDLNGDGHVDLVVTNQADGSFTVLINSTL